MLNLNIKILTTGLPPPTLHRCYRCKRVNSFKSGDKLRAHTELEHHRAETHEEKEGRIQNARWSELTPDPRIRDKISGEIQEELILIHKDDIHYNLIVHKSHNTFKTNDSKKDHISKHDEPKETIFGDLVFTSPLTWAQVTEKSTLQTSKTNTEVGRQTRHIESPL